MAFGSGGYVISTNQQSFTGNGIQPDTLEKVARALDIHVKDGTISIHGHEVKVSDIISIHVFRPQTSSKKE